MDFLALRNCSNFTDEQVRVVAFLRGITAAVCCFLLLVVLWQDSNFRFVHVFTGSNSIFHENAVAIEPMSAMADAYNNHDHLTTLSAGETWGGSFGVYVE